ncbi:MAG: VOC family protein [Clostridia bacterium]|nr:VOC family protein [Clostridia bacterium]
MKIHHICIQTNCYEKSKKFYIEILGFKLVKETINFHGRAYNTWLDLNGFMIELQTGKEQLVKYNKDAEGIVHFALYEENIEKFLSNIKDIDNIEFKRKNGNIIYQVENSKLVKLIAPEGTIVEIRDSINI